MSDLAVYPDPLRHEADADAPPRRLSRRLFLRAGALALLGSALTPASAERAAVGAAAPAPRRRILVTVFLRGAADGLSMVIPYREREYYRLRTGIAIAPPSRQNDEAGLDLDGTFALHPALGSLKPMYDGGMLAVVHATGSPDPTRSHFDAQDALETAAPARHSVHDGWLNRYLSVQRPGAAPPFRAVAASATLPRALQGQAPALAIPDLRAFGVHGGSAATQRGFEGLYASAASDLLRGTGSTSFRAVDMLAQRVSDAPYTPQHGAVYPARPFGRQMQQIAQLIKADLGLEIACADIGGWDTHAAQGGARGALATSLRTLSDTLAAFCRDLGDRMEDVLILTMSEFGRTVEENGSGGTDHGHGSLNLAIGGRVHGGRVYGRWPGLAQEARFEQRDLAVTTDFRDVFGEALTRHLACPDPKRVLAGHAIDAARFVGFLA